MTKYFKIILTFSILTLCSYSTIAQDYIFSEKVHVDSIDSKKGPNLRHFRHFYFGYGMHFDDNKNVNKDILGKSYFFELGWRYKYRPFNLIHFGSDVSYTINRYKLFSTPPAVAMMDTYKRHFNIHSLRAAPYLRFNCYNRGNRIAFYLDLLAYGNLNFRAVSVERYDEVYSFSQQVEHVKRKARGNDFVEKFDAGVGIRLGYHRFALFLNYSLIEVENLRSSEFIDFYPVSAGIQIGLF